MQKSFVLAAGLVLALGGCHSKSPTWQKVVSTSRAVGDAEDAPRAYAGELHRVLADAAVPHKVVTFEFGYQGFLDPFMTANRTAVIYQDSASIRHPWWLMDRTLDRPVWLPTAPVEEQVSFYVRRPARVVDVRDYSGFDDKDIHATETPRRRSATSRIEPVSAKAGSRAPKPTPVETLEAKPKRGGIFHQGIFAPRNRPAEPAPASAPAAKKPPTTSIQPVTTTRAKPVRVEPVKASLQKPVEAAPVAVKKTEPAAKPAEVKVESSNPVEAPGKSAQKSPKAKAGPAPKAALPWNSPAPWEEPVVLEPRGAAAVPAAPKPDAPRKKGPRYTDPAEKPKTGKPEIPAEPPKPQPKFRKPLVPQPKEADEPKPSAEAEKPRLLQRIFGSGTRRLFTRA